MRTTNRSSRIGFLTAIGGLALVLAACSSSGASTAPSAAAPSAAAPSAAAPSAAAAGGETYTVAVATGAVGSFLTGEDGKTLYIFTPDSTNTDRVRRQVRRQLAAVHHLERRHAQARHGRDRHAGDLRAA